MERPDLGGGRQALEFLVVPHPLCKAWFALWVLVPGHGGKHWALAGSPPELSCGDWRGAPLSPTWPASSRLAWFLTAAPMMLVFQSLGLTTQTRLFAVALVGGEGGPRPGAGTQEAWLAACVELCALRSGRGQCCLWRPRDH